jgi:hypothetical protein
LSNLFERVGWVNDIVTQHIEVLIFIEFMLVKNARQALPSKHKPALLSEQALAVDWNRPKEDNAWRSFQ